MKGTTAHADATRLMYLEKQEWTEDDIKAKVAISQLGLNLTSEVFKRYNATWPSLTAMISDIRTVCPLLHLAKQIPSTSFYVATEVSYVNWLNLFHRNISLPYVFGVITETCKLFFSFRC